MVTIIYPSYFPFFAPTDITLNSPLSLTFSPYSSVRFNSLSVTKSTLPKVLRYFKIFISFISWSIISTSNLRASFLPESSAYFFLICAFILFLTYLSELSNYLILHKQQLEKVLPAHSPSLRLPSLCFSCWFLDILARILNSSSIHTYLPFLPDISSTPLTKNVSNVYSLISSITLPYLQPPPVNTLSTL